MSEEHITVCLLYAKALILNGLPVIYDGRHLSRLCGYSLQYLYGVSNTPDGFYRRFEVPKKSGGVRVIHEPLPSLKEIQRWILDNILTRVSTNPAAKAYAPGKSIKENARFHRNQEKILQLDLKNFFPSINPRRINGLFLSLGYLDNVAKFLTQLCILNNSLPQGAPTSPMLSNIVCREMDARFLGFAKSKGLRYTRYADDITFSGSFHEGRVLNFCKKVLSENDFEVNDKKTRISRDGSRKVVTGIIVNEVRIRVPREIKRKLRQNMYYIRKFGFDSHVAKTEEERYNYIYHLMGMANYILYVDPKDEFAKESLKTLKRISRE